MTNKEMQKAIQFLLDHHAQFVVEMEQIREVQAKAQAQINRLTDAVLAMIGDLGRLNTAQERLAEAQERTEAKVAELAEKLAEYGAKGAETEERLNAFIVVVERLINERRNGRRRKPKKG